MNIKQRRTLITAAVLIAALLLIPPVDYRIGGLRYLKYRFLFDSIEGAIDVPFLFAEWVAVCLICGVAFVLFANNSREK